MSRRFIKWLTVFTILLTLAGIMTLIRDQDLKTAKTNGVREVSAANLIPAR